MRTLSLSLALALVTTCCHNTVPSTTSKQYNTVETDSLRGRFSPDVVIATYSDSESKGRLLEVCNIIGATIVYDYTNFNMVAIRRPANMRTAEVISTLSKVDGVLGVVEDQMCEINSQDSAPRM